MIVKLAYNKVFLHSQYSIFLELLFNFLLLPQRTPLYPLVRELWFKPWRTEDGTCLMNTATPSTKEIVRCTIMELRIVLEPLPPGISYCSIFNFGL